MSEGHRVKAETYKKKLFKEKVQVVRYCLKCRKDFKSRGDRLCPICNADNISVPKLGQSTYAHGTKRRGKEIA